jgi:hypothetical protein
MSGPQLTLCTRSGCGQAAVVTLTFEYATRQVWLSEFVGGNPTNSYALCGDHAGRLTVPLGWEKRDMRGGEVAAGTATAIDLSDPQPSLLS